MSKSLITRFGRKCRSCNKRKKSVVSRAWPRIQIRTTKSGVVRSWSTPRTLLCDACTPVSA